MGCLQRSRAIFSGFVISVTLMLTACGGGSASFSINDSDLQSNPNQNSSGQNFVTVNISQNSGLAGSKNFQSNWLIQDASTWSTVWANHQSGQSPQEILPNVDFNREQVVGIARTSSNGCTKPFIQNIYFLINKVLVEINEQTPSAEQFCSQQHSTVVQFVITQRSNLPVEFVDLQAGS